MKLLITALNAKAGCGKSTTVGYIIDACREDPMLHQLHSIVRKFSIADPLKDMTSHRYCFPREWCDTQEGKLRTPAAGLALAEKLGIPEPTVRDLLVYVAKQERERRGPACWVNDCLMRIARWMDDIAGQDGCGVNLCIALIDDLRYLHEVEAIRTHTYDGPRNQMESYSMLVRLDPYPGYVAPEAIRLLPGECELDDHIGFDVRWEPDSYGLDGLWVCAQQVTHMMTTKMRQVFGR